MHKIVRNYEALTDEEKKLVPDISYNTAVYYVTAREAARDVKSCLRRNDGSIADGNSNNGAASADGSKN